VNRQLGPGYDEASYANALELELVARDIPFEREVWIDILYRGQVVGRRRMDFVIAGCLLIEIKAVDQLVELHRAQVISYLKLTGFKLGLLINFNVGILTDGLRRIIRG
jgi:GxxExxY protein